MADSRMLRPDDVAVVIPALNEALRIREVVSGALAFCPHVIVVDDGSDDGTVECIADLPVTVLRHARRGGKGQALRSGFAEAVRRGLRGVLTMDGDGQHAATDLPRLLASANRHPGCIIIGARLRKRASQPLLRRKQRVVLGRQPGAFPPEHEHIARFEADVAHTALRLGRQRVDMRGGRAGVVQRLLQGVVHSHRLPFVVIQPRPPHAGIVELESQRTHQVQLRTGIGAQADRIARVGRDLGTDEDDVEHGEREDRR